MRGIQIPHVQATSMLRPMSSGRTKPCLMLCKDEEGRDYEAVVKWRAAMDMKETGLVCELISALLAEDLDLPAAKPSVVEVTPDFCVGEGKPELAQIVQRSAGLNFGSQRLPTGAAIWPKDKPIPLLLRALAADIFAFDVLIQNPDRRRENPNILWSGDELYLCDHEQSFSFLMGVIGWQPPWTGHGTEFYRNHVFYQQLRGGGHDWKRLSGALEALTDARLVEYVGAVPSEWRTTDNAAGRIVEYLQGARENRVALFGVIDHLLSK